MPQAIYNLNANSDSVRVLVNSMFKDSDITADEKIHDHNHLRSIQLTENETWVYIYPEIDTMESGMNFNPSVNQVVSALEGSRSQAEVQHVNIESTQRSDIESRILRQLNRTYASL